ncbi:MAG TPA: hypothetical protein VJV79_00250 [Polyangiaceae bacterium]|nr:hypothetical protein [Polyangiaceae bacterium]
MPSSVPAAPVSSEIRSDSLAPNLVVTWFTGYITTALAEHHLLRFRGLLNECVNPIWIMDLTRMNGFDPQAIEVAGEWWRCFVSKHEGRSDILLISSSPAARMAGASLSSSMGVGVRSYANFEERFEALGVVLPIARLNAG